MFFCLSLVISVGFHVLFCFMYCSLLPRLQWKRLLQNTFCNVNVKHCDYSDETLISTVINGRWMIMRAHYVQHQLPSCLNSETKRSYRCVPTPTQPHASMLRIGLSKVYGSNELYWWATSPTSPRCLAAGPMTSLLYLVKTRRRTPPPPRRVRLMSATWLVTSN